MTYTSVIKPFIARWNFAFTCLRFLPIDGQDSEAVISKARCKHTLSPYKILINPSFLYYRLFKLRQRNE